MIPLEVRLLPIDEVKPAAYNPRRVLSPSSPGYRKLKRSLCEFGLVEPLVWNELSGQIVGGHLRYKILCELGYTHVPVSVVRLCESREMALNIVLNNREAQGRYDPAKLSEILTQLQSIGELEITGFDAGVLRNLTLDAVEVTPEDPTPNAIEVTLTIPQSQYAEVSPALDDLIRTHDLVSHMRGKFLWTG